MGASLRPAAVALAALLFGCRARTEPGPRVIVGVPAGLPSLEAPHSHFEEYAMSVLGNVYEQLHVVGPNLELAPGLADSWTTEDARTWVFRLREGVRWHDGRILEAHHVVASLRASLDDPRSAYAAGRSVIESAVARDNRTVVITTRQPVTSLRGLGLGPIWAPSDEPGRPALGTGPYRIADWQPDGSVVLRAFDEHWRGKPALTTLDFRVIPDARARVARLLSGELDLIVDPPADALPALEDQAAIKTAFRGGLRIVYLGMNCAARPPPGARWRANPLAEARARRAVAQAIDRQALVHGPLGGYAEMVDQAVAPEVFGFSRDVSPIDFDPAGSRRILQRMTPRSLSLEIEYPSDKYRAVAAVAEAVASDLRGVGIDARLVPMPWSEFNAPQRARSLAWIAGWLTTTDAGNSYDYLLHSRVGGLGYQNDMAYASAEVDAALDAARSELVHAVRLQHLSEVARLVRQDMPLVPLYRQADLYAFKAELEFQPRLDRGINGLELRWRR